MSDSFREGDRVQSRTDGRVGTIENADVPQGNDELTYEVRWDDGPDAAETVTATEVGPV